MRGIGEPVWPGRSEAELEECQRHESLLNVAFAYGPAWSLLCPYDLDGLAPQQINAARVTHPALMHEGISRRSDAYLPLHRARGSFAERCRPATRPRRAGVHLPRAGRGARLVSSRAERAGLAREAREDIVLAVNELVTNSVQYGGGGGTLRIWTESDALVCDVRDRGYIEDPLAGRIAPPLDQHGGRGLWLVNHLCDLVQIRSTPNGTIVRVRTRSKQLAEALALFRVDSPLQLRLVHARAPVHAELARLFVELIARSSPRTGFAGAQSAAAPRGDVPRGRARALLRFAAAGTLLVDRARGDLLGAFLAGALLALALD